MGYRNYIATIPKRDYNKIKSLTKNQLFEYYGLSSSFEDEEPYMGVYEFGKELYEFGKYVDFKPPKKSIKKFFKKKELEDYYNSDHELKVITKEFLEYIIENYRDKIKTYYNEILSGIERENKETWTAERFAKLFEHVRSFSIEWIQLKPYNLENGEAITQSWKFEYVVFELVRIYKTFDWKRNVMFYYGY